MVEIKMKFRILLCSFLLFSVGVFAGTPNDSIPEKKADTTKPWSYKGQYAIMLNQISFKNWASGGESSLSGRASVDYHLKYKKERFSFDHTAHIAYGMVGYLHKRIQKTDDKIDLLFALSNQVSKSWYFTSIVSFKTQFSKGYKNPDFSHEISDFMAPGYLTISIGFRYKAKKNFELFMSPLAGKVTFVLDQYLANQGAFGVKKAVLDTLGNVIIPGENIAGQLGINILSSYQANIMKNILFKTRINLYNNYLEENPEKRWQIDMDWNNALSFKINKYFSTVLLVQLRYDPNALFPVYKNVDGNNMVISEKSKLQWKQSLGISFLYNVGNR
jgi:hypothetical protein